VYTYKIAHSGFAIISSSHGSQRLLAAIAF